MILSEKCIGCQACVDTCSTKAISFLYNNWGEGKAYINGTKCINCKLCDKICPALNQKFNDRQDKVYAILSKKNKSTGSSGGFFYELACQFINDGGIVYGAMFDNKLKLIHKGVDNIDDLIPLCKSKYIHSDMTNIYNEIKQNLISGRKIMFVGTPCQVSAVKNMFSDRFSQQLLLVDFLCHGTGTQKVFDLCIKNEEMKKRGKIIKFSFRSKSRKAEHSYSYILEKKGKQKTISGYAFEFPYYYSYLKYSIFNDYCYYCNYAKNERVGDITLGDFWGIQQYNSKLKDFKGVSMISINNEKGISWFNKIKNKCDVYDYPIEYATSKNESFNKPVQYPKKKKDFVNILEVNGETVLIENLSCPSIKKNLIYAKIPSFIKKIYSKLKGNK